MLMESQIKSLPRFEKVEITYTLYPESRRLCDLSNVCSIHDKYFCDALAEFGKIADDNYKYVPSVIYKFGSVDKDNPRVDIEIKEIGH